MSAKRPKRVLLAGGGTMGSVSPLLALLPELKEAGVDVRWIGTRTGPERAFVEKAGVEFSWITTAKFHRYITPRLLIQPFSFLLAIGQAKWQLLKWRPDLIVSAAGFTAVPLTWVGWFWRIPSVIHQQDLHPSMSNKLMAPCARKITVAFEESVKHFGDKAEWIGNPVRDLTPTTEEFTLDSNYPTVLITGGGTGAQALNELVTADLCEFANVIHLTGKGREGEMEQIEHERYHKYEFLGEEMKEALHKADVVVARAGLGTISELAALGKPAIIMPMPDTHQEANARMLAERSAAVVLNQKHTNAESFTMAVEKLATDAVAQKAVSENISALYKPEAEKRLKQIVLEV